MADPSEWQRFLQPVEGRAHSLIRNFLQLDLERVLHYLGRFIRTSCATAQDVLQLCHLDSDTLSRDEQDVVEGLLAASGITNCSEAQSCVESFCSRPGLFSHHAFEFTKAMQHQDATSTVHYAIGLAAISRLSSRSPLSRLSDDLLAVLMRYAGQSFRQHASMSKAKIDPGHSAGSVVVPDECTLLAAFLEVGDFHKTGQCIMVRGGDYTTESVIEVDLDQRTVAISVRVP